MGVPFSKLKIKNSIYDVKDSVARENIGNLNNLETDHKQNLVEAINDAAQNGGISNSLKSALLQIASKVAYIDTNGQTYYDDLYDALYPEMPILESISAVYTQSGIVYENATLNSLKSDLVVTASYDNGSTSVLDDTDYTLSGTLTTGTSTITVTYEDKTDTFNVTVTAVPALSSISAVFTQGQTVVYDTDSLDSLKSMLVVTAIYSDSSTEVIPANDYTLSGTLTVGTSVITVSYEGETDTFNVTVTASATLVSISAVFTQGQTVVYDTDSLDSLKSMLVVTATYSDSATRTVPSTDYTLSGTLTVGTSTITVSYEGETDTFNVTVTASATLVSISAVFTQGQTVVYDTDSLDSLKSMLVVTATYSDSSTATVPSSDYTLSGTLTVGTSTITVSYEGETDTFTVTVTEAPPMPLHDWDFTQSLTDSIGGITAVESHYDNAHPLTRTSEGLIYDYGGQCIDLGAVYDRGITIDLYVTNFSMNTYNGHIRFLMYGTDAGTGSGLLIYHFKNIGWSAYIEGAWASVFTGLTSRSALDTVNESKITIAIADDGTVTMYINDAEIGSLNLKAPVKGNNHLYIGNSSTPSAGANFYSAKVKRVVIY